MNIVVSSIKYFAGWADKITGQSIEVSDLKTQLRITNVCIWLDWWEKIGIHSSWTLRSRRPDHSMWVSLTFHYTSESCLIQCYDQGTCPVSPLSINRSISFLILPFPKVLMWAWKVGPALATGNTIVLKVRVSSVVSPVHSRQTFSSPQSSPLSRLSACVPSSKKLVSPLVSSTSSPDTGKLWVPPFHPTWRSEKLPSPVALLSDVKSWKQLPNPTWRLSPSS